jgi:hypothetical protein
MATAPEHLTPEEEQRSRDYEASYKAGRRAASHPAFMALLREKLAALNSRLSRRSH